jgi:GTP-binding protein EngB required for normal cell division
MKHLSLQQFSEYVDGQCDETVRAEAARHLAECAQCRAKLENCRQESLFLADVRAAVDAEQKDPFPAAVDHLILSKIPEIAGTAFKPNTKASHPDAPRIPDYILTERLGDGAFGVVWRAEDMLGHPCAVKILPKHQEKNAGDYELNNLRAALQVRHPNLVDVRHIGQTDDMWYYIMELVSETLADRLRKTPVLSVDQTCALATQLLDALGACHAGGIAHRDVKPANIGFTESGQVKLLDLGLVTSSSRGDWTMVGTPDYMPYKRAKNPALDDLYALGMVLYQSLTGHAPDTFPSCPAHLPDQPLRQKFIEGILVKAVDSDPADRVQSAEEFKNSVKTFSDSVRNVNGGRLYSQEHHGGDSQPKEAIMKSQKIEEVVQFLDSNKLPVSKCLREECANLKAPRYKIGFVGQFQVGKSTLINKVFLRDNLLLKEGIGTCTTAVATELLYGDTKRMEVYPWKTTVLQDGVTVISGTDTGEAVVVDNPTVDDIAAATAASRQEDRTALAQNTATVKLCYPLEALKRYTLYDTPGIDDPNIVLLDNTTYRILPVMDVAVMLVESRMLDAMDLNFLRSRMLDQGLSRVMLLVSYKPEQKKLSASSRQGIIDTIKAQLSNIGREYIPVCMYCFDDTVEDVLNTPDDIEAVILDFLSENVVPGREEKARFVAKRDLQAAMAQVAAEIAFAGKSETEKSALLENIVAQEAAFKEKYAAVTENIESDLRQLKLRVLSATRVQVVKSGEDYLAGFDTCTDFASAQNLLNRAESMLKPDVERIVCDLAKTVKDEVKGIIERNGQKLPTLLDFGKAANLDLSIDGGILAKLSPLVLTLADLILTIWVIPGGPIINLIERFIATKIPFIKKLVPAQIVKELMISTVKSSVREEIVRIAEELSHTLDGMFVTAENAVKDSMRKMFDSEIGVVRKAAEKAAPVTLTAREQAQLLTIKAGLDEIIQEI